MTLLKAVDSGVAAGGIAALDCSIVELRGNPNSLLISTTDFFYPLVDDPELQGRIACANVLSDLYALGIDECDTMLMLLGASLEMEPHQRMRSTELVMRGFNATAAEAGTTVTGGQSVLNPWPLIGGVASRVCARDECVIPEFAVAGDVLVLTKALGTQLAVNALEWYRLGELEKRAPSFVAAFADVDEAVAALSVLVGKANASMARLNRMGARAMRVAGAHAGTDVTGFGIIGHAQNLAKAQRAAVRLVIDTLVLLEHTELLAKDHGYFRLMEGYSSETSGGLLVCLPADRVDVFRETCDGEVWVIGHVVACEEGQDRDAVLVEKTNVINV